jgi:hypothetical protein
LQGYTVFLVRDDGTTEEIDPKGARKAMQPNAVIIFVDHGKRQIYNFNGREADTRLRFAGARLANEFRNDYGMYSVSSIHQGDKPTGFGDFLTSLSSGLHIDKDAERTMTNVLSSPRTAEADFASTAGWAMPREVSHPSLAEPTEHSDVNEIISQFGTPPAGFTVEANIVGDVVYKQTEVRTTVMGKQIVQNRMEKVDVDGTFETDGKIRLIAKNNTVLGIQILVKSEEGKTAPSKEPRKKSKGAR